MANRQVTKEEMLARTARLRGLRPSKQAFVDTRIGGAFVVGDDPAIRPGRYGGEAQARGYGVGRR